MKVFLAKLRLYENWGVSEDWFRSYLTNRRQKVEIKSPDTTKTFFSDWDTLKFGVPQGSILGLLLFKIHVNELPLRINCVSETMLFADDTIVIISNRNFEYFYSVSNLVLSHMIN